jgi:hypothetical protein
MAQQIQLRRGTAAAATAANATLAIGELGLETDTGKLKIGDGVTAWNSLGYATSIPSGGTTGQTLVKASNASYDLAWGSASAGFADKETPTGLINSSNAVYTLAHTPSPAASLQLFRNGVLQTAGGVDYTLATATITYATAPTTGDTHVCWYRY